MRMLRTNQSKITRSQPKAQTIRLSNELRVLEELYFYQVFITIAVIVEFRIPGYPGPSKEQGTEVRLMRGKIFRGKIRMYLQLYVVYNYDF